MRPARVRTTDYRPQPAGGKPAMTGLDHLAVNQGRDAAEHDRWVATYSAEMLEAAWDDLSRRAAWDRKNPEHRWVMGRRAAIARAAARMERSAA